MKKIFKLFLLVIVILLVTGCKATYNLNISDTNTFDEDFQVYTDDVANLNVPVSNGASYKDLFDAETDNYRITTRDLANYDPYQADPQSGFSYYSKSFINNSSMYGVKYTHSFNLSDYVLSSGVGQCYRDIFAIKENDYFVFSSGKNSGCFINFPLLTDLTINVTLSPSFSMLYNNADSVNDNVYTWNINSSNFDTKMISFSYNTNPTTVDKELSLIEENKKNEENKTETYKNNGFNLLIVILIVLCALALTGIIYLFVKYKSKKNNKI